MYSALSVRHLHNSGDAFILLIIIMYILLVEAVTGYPAGHRLASLYTTLLLYCGSPLVVRTPKFRWVLEFFYLCDKANNPEMSAQIEAPPALTSKEKQYILRHPADAQLEALLRECNAR